MIDHHGLLAHIGRDHFLSLRSHAIVLVWDETQIWLDFPHLSDQMLNNYCLTVYKWQAGIFVQRKTTLYKSKAK